MELREHSSLEDVQTLKDSERRWTPAFVSTARRQHSGEEVCSHTATSTLSEHQQLFAVRVTKKLPVCCANSLVCIVSLWCSREVGCSEDTRLGGWSMASLALPPPAPSHGSAWAGGHYGCEKCSSSIHDQRVEKIVLLKVCWHRYMSVLNSILLQVTKGTHVKSCLDSCVLLKVLPYPNKQVWS